ncbi:4,5-dihydroxyphthalate dehydrogenase [Paraburkholderia sp. BL6669N2]|uniref:Gfo/Idh/MocA family protein n=1 Tax=Paraburkholderia sp. BL6669N2 TaxID=1938807 RepID=UPI000E24A020|nr:Gfo/Idh/MocA family oxidoreductase [Paraburkholderia sp. BL6669N2]REG49057.1 4,5-dihydroxyphthalate dehydrogenase [Paraburkholderia sp. BL6669N2]
MEPVRIGVAGLGRAFSLMLPTFLADVRVKLAGACDPRASACAQFAADFDAPTFSSIDELAAMADLDAIYIASPHQFHAAHTQISARRGKHVLVEKPMALSLAECDAMIEVCRDANVHLIVGHCHSFDTPYLRTRDMIGSGAYGPVRMIHALNYTDYLFRPRRPEELSTAEGGGAIFSQAAHQVDVVRLLAGSRATRVRAAVGNWDTTRPTEGAYSATLWFESGAFATLSYNGYAHFDSDEWTGWTGEMGQAKRPDDYGSARRRLSAVRSSDEEARLKAAGTYGGSAYRPPLRDEDDVRQHQHFGPVIVSCERGDLRPLPDSIIVYGDELRERIALDTPTVPRSEVIDELVAAVQDGVAPLHDGRWARGTLEICIAMLRSGEEQRDVLIEDSAMPAMSQSNHQVNEEK